MIQFFNLPKVQNNRYKIILTHFIVINLLGQRFLPFFPCFYENFKETLKNKR